MKSLKYLYANICTWVLIASCCVFCNLALCESIPTLSPQSKKCFPQDLIELIHLKYGFKVIKTENLEGLINQNYLVTFEDHTSAVVKVFNLKVGGKELRKKEWYNQNLACAQSISPQMDLINDEVGLIEYLPHESEFFINEENVLKCAQLMAKLHRSNLAFQGAFDFSNWARAHLDICNQERKTSPEENAFIENVIERFQKLTPYLNRCEKVPCHNDLHASNIISGPRGLHFIDWEDSSMNDSAWDISYFFITSFVPEDLWPCFLKEYQTHTSVDDPALMRRIQLYRPFILLRIALALKTYLHPEEQALENFSQLIHRCMGAARQIFENQDYQKLLLSFEKNQH